MICKECGNETCGTGIPERDMPICGWCYGDLVGAPRIGDMSEGGNLSVWLDDCPATELLKKVGFQLICLNAGAARDLGHEAEVDALCVLYENDASGNDIKASFRGLIKKETLRFNELAA